jgi:hypothetical protein
LLFPWFSTERKIELGYRIDLVVERLVIVEVKSVEAVHPVHQAQLMSYLRLSGIGVGLLINFYASTCATESSEWSSGTIGRSRRFTQCSSVSSVFKIVTLT